MNEQINELSNQKWFFLLRKISSILIFIIIISPIIAMLSYLIFLDHSINNHSIEEFNTSSTMPTYIFSSVICIAGMIGFFITIAYIILAKKESKLTIDKKILILSIVFLCWIFICDIFAYDKYAAFFGDTYRQEGFFTIISYFGICGCSYIALKSKKNFRFFLRLFVTTSSTVAFFALLQSFGLYIPFFEYGRPNTFFTGPFMQFNHYGYYLVMGLFAIMCSFYLEEKRNFKYLMLVAFFLQSYILVLNNTFGCYLAVIVGLIFFVIINSIRNGKTSILDYSFILILLASSLIALVTPYPSIFADFVKLFQDVSDIASGKEANTAGTHRWFLWKTSIKIIGYHPIFGIGSDNGTYEMYNNITDRPHNEFIQYTLFYGIPGFIMYLSLLIMILFPCLKKVKSINSNTYSCFLIAIAYLLSSMFGNTMYYTLPFFLFFLIGCLAQKNNENIDNAYDNELKIYNIDNDSKNNQ